MARYEQKIEDEAYRAYVSENLRIIGQNTAMCLPGCGLYIDKTLNDIMHPKREDTRTCSEIVDDIVSRCGLEIK